MVTVWGKVLKMHANNVDGNNSSNEQIAVYTHTNPHPVIRANYSKVEPRLSLMNYMIIINKV
jgi:hypothetical protein